MSNQINIVQVALSIAKDRQDEIARLNAEREASNLIYERELLGLKETIQYHISRIVGHTTKFGEINVINDSHKLAEIANLNTFCIIQINEKRFAGIQAWLENSEQDKKRYNKIICNAELYAPDYKCYSYCTKNWFGHGKFCQVKKVEINSMTQVDYLLQEIAQQLSHWV